MSGASVAQLLNLIALPLLTRLYYPEAFGWAATFIAMVETAALLINGGYDLAIMLPKKMEDAHKMTMNSMYIAMICVVMLSMLLLIFNTQLLQISSFAPLKEFSGWLIVSLLLEGVLQPAKIALSRLKSFKVLSIGKLLRTSVQIAVSLIWSIKQDVFTGLLVAYILGQWCSALYLMWNYIKKVRLQNIPLFVSFSWKLMSDYRDFPFFSLVGNALNKASKQLPLFMFPLIFVAIGNIDTIMGWYSKAEQILNIQIGLIGLSIGQVFYEKANRIFNDHPNEFGNFVSRKVKQFALIGLPITISLILLGPILMKVVLGPEWEHAGSYVRWMAPAYYLTFIVVPLSWLVDIKRKLKDFLLINVVIFALRLLCLLVGSRYLTPDGVIYIYATLSFLLAILQLGYLLHIGDVFKPLKA